jgi:hypothetical protein
MAARTAAQEEFDTLVSRASRGDRLASHREDRHYNEEDKDEEDDESRYRQEKIDEAMRTPVFDNGLMGRLPPRAFDDGKATGVKGVIADARNYVESKREGWRSQSVPGRKTSPSRSRINKSNAKGGEKQGDGHRHHSDSDGEEDEDEEFLSQWREARRRELLLGEGINGAAGGNDIRNKRRTSPSLRRFGRFDEVDAVGYLDAIEKVGRETVVVVFVYDDAVCLSQPHPLALGPLALGLLSLPPRDANSKHNSPPSPKSSKTLSPLSYPSIHWCIS